MSEQRVAWVTGASGALGQSIAAALRADGAHVIMSSRRGDAFSCDALGLEFVPLDVTDRPAVDAAAGHILERHGRIDALVTCTTVPVFGDFLALTDEDWDQVLNTKLMGSIRVVRAALPAMLAQGDGRIVLISGRGGTVPPPRHLPGACANASLNLLVQGLATSYGRQGIRVNALAPGPVVSPRLDAMQASATAGIHNALGAPATPQDVAGAALFLLSDAARHITGTTLHVDGGRAP
jgi:NAD(P)-dependent dehydrogenase (short-subunit alcohol dehydrogenase family)